MPFFERLNDISIGSISLGLIVSSAVILVICLITMTILNRLAGRALEKSKLEKGLKNFIKSVLKISLWFFTVVIVADNLGISTTSLVAVFSVVGLAFSLSVQNIMSNLFSGVTILATKPFKSGDYVELSGVSGSIDSIGLFHTTLKTPDNQLIYVPNSDVTSSKIINYSHEPLRRVELKICAAYGCSTNDVKTALYDVMAGESRLLSDPAPFAALLSYKENGVEYVLRAWVNREDYWPVHFALNENIREAFAKRGITIPCSRVDVNIVGENAPVED